jgi:hypothetical protein
MYLLLIINTLIKRCFELLIFIFCEFYFEFGKTALNFE